MKKTIGILLYCAGPVVGAAVGTTVGLLALCCVDDFVTVVGVGATVTVGVGVGVVLSVDAPATD